MRRLLVLVCTIVFVDAMLFGALSPLIPGYADEFDLSKTGAGLLVAAFGAGALVGGIPGGFGAARLGPRKTVVFGLVLFALASFAFAVSGSPWTLGASRFVQGASSTITWAGAFGWLVVAAPRDRRGEILGTAFGAAVAGAILGPMFGAVAHAVGIGLGFTITGLVGLALAAWAATNEDARPQGLPTRALTRALRDHRFVGGLWLNTLPALLFGVLAVLAPLALDDHGFGPLAIGAVFLGAGVVEVFANPWIGRVSDRRGRLLPTQFALAGSVLVAIGLAIVTNPAPLVILVCAAAVTFGGFYTPGMALVSDRAEAAGLAQGLAFGVMNSAWAAGNLAGPAIGGALAQAFGDAVPYLTGSVLCLLTLAATVLLRRGALESRREPFENPVGVE
jgi:MFS family permease